VRFGLIGFLLAAVVAGGATAQSTAPAAKKCPRGKAKVTIAGKSSCRPLASVLPRRRTGNGLAPVLRLALEPTWGETRNGPATLTQLVGPETKRAIDASIPRLLARLKTLGGGRFLASAHRAAAAKCKSTRTLPVTSQAFKEDLGAGATLEAEMRSGPDGVTMSIGMTIPLPAAKAVRITVDLGLCSGERLEVDSCPTAQGVVEGRDNNEGTIKIEQLEDGAVVEAQTTKIKVETKLRGQVGDDAKLESIKIDRLETYNTSIDYGRWFGVEQRMTVRREGTIAMPSGKYVGTGNLDIQQSFHGLLSFLVNESAARAAAIAEARKASDDAWSAFVDEVIKKYRERENNGWQKPDACAKVEFTPKSNTLRVIAGQRGQFSGTVRAQRGGTPEGVWKLTARKRLEVSPAAARASKQTFRYRVERDGGVAATFRVTSKAGLAAPTWEQGERKLPRRITGSFTGRTGPNGAYSWSGTIAFVRDPDRSSPLFAVYAVENVVFTVTYVVAENGCSGRSESRATLGRQSPAASLLLSPNPDRRRRHRYMMSVALTAPLGQIAVTCAGVTLQPRPWTAVAILTTVPNAFDSDLKSFSGTNGLPGASFTWSLRGTT
jgi:hypothetical protein